MNLKLLQHNLAIGTRQLIAKSLLQFNLFRRRILSYDWILLVESPGEEAAPALLPLLPHLPPSVAAGIVEGKEEAAREFEGGELPIALNEGGGDDGGDGGVDQHT